MQKSTRPLDTMINKYRKHRISRQKNARFGVGFLTPAVEVRNLLYACNALTGHPAMIVCLQGGHLVRFLLIKTEPAKMVKAQYETWCGG
jgi:hypothetical protein